MYSSKQLRSLFLKFMSSKGHVIEPSASLVPKEDPTVLFTTAGMQPLIPYLLGQDHPSGQKRIANSQKCLRTGDIEEVGDNRHLSFFEMLGSWSLGDYFKKESIEWGFEFLTSKDWLALDPQRLFVTVYKGFGEVPEDEEAIEIWKALFSKVGIEPDIGNEYDFSNPGGVVHVHRITKRSGKDNWWGLPYKGPCGPCSEIYYLLDKHNIDFEKTLFPSMDFHQIEKFIDNEIVEIWNHVFMSYVGEKDNNDEPKYVEPLPMQNIDTGMGFERLLTVLNNFDHPYQSDLFLPIVETIEKWKTK